MKVKNSIITFMLLLGSFSNFEVSAITQDEIIGIAKHAACTACIRVMDLVSPGTGRDPDYEIDYESIVYDINANQLLCDVQLSWVAKPYMLFSGTKEQMTNRTWGKLYVDITDGSIKYVSERENDYLIKCAGNSFFEKPEKLEKLRNGVECKNNHKK